VSIKSGEVHSATLVGAALLALSYGAMALRVADSSLLRGLWGVLIIPAYLTILFGTVVATSLSIPSTVFIAAGAALWLAPFAGVDLLRRRLRGTSSAA
jgi:hypothetical protein